MTVYVPIDKCEECSYYEFGYDLDNGSCADICCYYKEPHIIYNEQIIQEWCPFLNPTTYIDISSDEITWKDLCCMLMNEKSILAFENSKLKQKLSNIEKVKE